MAQDGTSSLERTRVLDGMSTNGSGATKDLSYHSAWVWINSKAGKESRQTFVPSAMFTDEHN